MKRERRENYDKHENKKENAGSEERREWMGVGGGGRAC